MASLEQTGRLNGAAPEACGGPIDRPLSIPPAVLRLIEQSLHRRLGAVGEGLLQTHANQAQPRTLQPQSVEKRHCGLVRAAFVESVGSRRVLDRVMVVKSEKRTVKVTVRPAILAERAREQVRVA